MEISQWVILLQLVNLGLPLIRYVIASYFVDALHGILFLFSQMSVDAVMPGATLSLETPVAPPAVGSGAVPAGLKFSKSKWKEPAITVSATLSKLFSSVLNIFLCLYQSTDTTKAQVRYLFFHEVPGLDLHSSSYVKAVAYAKAGFEEIQRKRQRSSTRSDYIKVAEGTTLAFPNSAAQINGELSLFILFCHLIDS